MPKNTDETVEPLEHQAESGAAFWRIILPLLLLLVGASIGFVLTALG